MARWFKHSVLASQEVPVRDIYVKYSFHGIGVFWTMYERVCLNEGTLTMGDLVRMFRSRHFGADAVRDLVMGFGCFKVDSRGRVSVIDDLKQVELMESDAKVGLDAGLDTGPDAGLDTESNARTRNREDKKREEERERRVPTPSTVVPWGSKLRTDWVDEMKGRKGDVYFEMVCMKSGFGRLLGNYWDVAWDMYRSQVVLLGKDKEYCSESDVKTHFMYFVTHSPTHGEVMAALKEIADSNEDTDYMSTYTGPPLPEDAPPRPSHTAVYNENRNEWVEPR